jgi:hypothetical protein
MDLLSRAVLTLAALTLIGCASHPIPARIVKDPTTLSSCEYMGLASDTDYVDLAKKAGELRGTHAVIVREQPGRGPFGTESGREYVAEVYRCATVSRR